MALRIGIGPGAIPTAARPAATTAPENVEKPAFVGILTQGQTATINPGIWVGLPSPNFAYSVRRDGVEVATPVSGEYTWTADDVAAGVDAMTVVVAATNDIDTTTEESDPVTIAPPLEVSGTPGAATVGEPYSFIPVVAGGHDPYAAVLSGTLPSGFEFDDETGEIWTDEALSSGTAEDLTITFTDADGLVAVLGPFDLIVSVDFAPGLVFTDGRNAAAGLLLLLSEET